ncbi:MAG: hypothetical protein Q8R29_00370 [bacterium]|nr:hypothetical protein [bacterium]
MTITKALLIGLVIIIGVIILVPFFLRFATLPSGGGFLSSGSQGGSGREILISVDEGENWQEANKAEAKRERFPSRIHGLFFHPKESRTVYLGSESAGLWKSDNGGKSWRRVTDKNKFLKNNSTIYKLAISRSDPKIMYAAVVQDNRGRVLRSQDGGESFQEIYFINVLRTPVFDVSVDSVNPNKVLIATGQGGILETQNGGRTWRVKKWFGYPVQKLIGNNQSYFENYLITGQNQFLKTFDGGEEWEDFTENIRKAWINTQTATSQDPGNVFAVPDYLRPVGSNFQLALKTLTTDPNIFSVLYLGLPNALLRSYNGGVSWSGVATPIPPRESPITSVALSPRGSNIIFVGTGNQIYKSVDNGVNWKIINLSTKRKVRNIYINPLRPNDIFAVLQ